MQFNEVKNIEITGTTSPFDPNIGNPITTIGNITVPTGKVWKIESTSVKRNDISEISSASYVLILNNHRTSGNFSVFPIWLSAGNYLVKISGPASENVIASISAIEFNITP